MRAFVRQKNPLSSWDKYKDSRIGVHKAMETMHKISIDEMLEGIPGLLFGGALPYYWAIVSHCTKYEKP